MGLDANSTIQEICQSQEGIALLERYLPKLLRSPAFPMTRAMSFKTVCRFRRWRLSKAVYLRALGELGAIESNQPERT